MIPPGQFPGVSEKEDIMELSDDIMEIIEELDDEEILVIMLQDENKLDRMIE